MDKQAVVLAYNRIILSHKKECIWVSSNEVDETRAYYTEWSKSEREKQILYINTYMESRRMVLMNLFAKQQWRHRHREQTCGQCWGRRGRWWDEWREKLGCIYTSIWKQTANGNLLCDSGNSNGGLCNNLEGWELTGRAREIQEGGGICIPMVNSC